MSVIADQKLVSVGSVFKGTDGLYVEGKDSTALYAASTTTQSSSSTQTSSSFLGINLDNKTSNDSQAKSTSIGTRLVSTQKVEIGIGNKAELQGTDIDAPQITFTQTDPRRAGVLILGTSTDTTQTSHTEKNESLGLYQESKGQGSTVQTLNQTTLKGTTVATSATLAGSTAFATAVNAGFASLAAQASVAMVNNGGDIGKTLSQLGSEQSIKGS